MISQNTVTTIIDSELCKRIEHRQEVDFTELQQKSVSIYSNRIDMFALRPLQGFNDLYQWTLTYDKDFLGYMAGVMKLDEIESYII